jgi:hypothetical protein
VELLVIGSLVHGEREMEGAQSFIEGLPADELIGKKVAVFDTRFEAREQNFS